MHVLRSGNFWLLGAVFSLFVTAGLSISVNLVPFASDLGIPRERAAILLSIAALFSSAGKLTFGVIADRVDQRVALWIALVLKIVAWLFLMAEPSFAVLTFAIALFGLGGGATMPVQGAMIGSLFGRAHFGQVMGLMHTLMLLLPVCGPPLAGHFHDVTGDYGLALRVFLGALLLATLLLWFVRIPGPETTAVSTESAVTS